MTTTLRTNHYAIRDTCSHGVPWHADCPQCALISARETVRHWADLVDEARAIIAAAEQTTEEQR
jgi:hypothetical protein